MSRADGNQVLARNRVERRSRVVNTIMCKSLDLC